MSNVYGRDLEDQADRVGLRYAYEAGFDATKAPRLWKRFREKYPEDALRISHMRGAHGDDLLVIRLAPFLRLKARALA
jgi:predicted Zn-dependent protease